jgi:hypothetical protein
MESVYVLLKTHFDEGSGRTGCGDDDIEINGAFSSPDLAKDYAYKHWSIGHGEWIDAGGDDYDAYVVVAGRTKDGMRLIFHINEILLDPN